MKSQEQWADYFLYTYYKKHRDIIVSLSPWSLNFASAPWEVPVEQGALGLGCCSSTWSLDLCLLSGWDKSSWGTCKP